MALQSTLQDALSLVNDVDDRYSARVTDDRSLDFACAADDARRAISRMIDLINASSNSLAIGAADGASITFDDAFNAGWEDHERAFDDIFGDAIDLTGGALELNDELTAARMRDENGGRWPLEDAIDEDDAERMRAEHAQRDPMGGGILDSELQPQPMTWERFMLGGETI